MASKDRFEVKPFLARLQHMPLADQCARITAKRGELELDLVSIQEQIATAHVAERHDKPEWWKRIQGARHVKGIQIEELSAALGRISTALRAESSAASDTHTKSLARCFMMAAEERLSPEDYSALLERARQLQDGDLPRQKFVGKLYYADEDGILYFITAFDITATSRVEAERAILDLGWDARLDGASCSPHFEYESESDEETEEPIHAEAATENS